jgi:hypothetical protein
MLVVPVLGIGGDADVHREIDLEPLHRERLPRELGAALIRYLVEVTPGKKGAEQERFRIGKWLRDPLSNQPLTAIRTSDLAGWRDARKAAPSTIRNSLSIISQVFKVAASEWGMERLHNPVSGLRMPRNRPPRDRRLEVGEGGEADGGL